METAQNFVMKMKRDERLFDFPFHTNYKTMSVSVVCGIFHPIYENENYFHKHTTQKMFADGNTE